MRRAFLFAAGLFLTAGSLARPPESFPRGTVVEKVSCAADSGQTYALYLPAGYDPARRWPILYLFDPGARGKRAVEPFRKGAEAYGFLLAASNNSQNGPMEQSLVAARAVWKDTHARFAIDDRRISVAGFSGGARVAALLGQQLAGSVSGVIGCGAGFPDGRPPAKDLSFSYFGAVGDTDFNYAEMQALDATLEKLGVRHRLAIFEGPHQWPPEDVCAEALEWMRVQEAARGIEKDPTLLEAAWERRRTRAQEAEAAGRLLDAEREYTSIARDFQGLRNIAEVEKRISDLRRDARLTKLRAAQAKRESAERAAIERLSARLDTLRGADPPALPRLLADLEITDWKKKGVSSDRDDALSARRVLEWLFVRASAYLSQELLARKDFSRAILSLTVATEIKPENWRAWYNRACGEARAGQRGKALEDLRAAVAKGLRDRALVESDSDLESLRADEEFRKIVEGIDK